MKAISLRFLTVIFFVSLGISGIAQDCAVYHEVAAGETLYAISRRYGFKVAEVQALNPGLTENIHVGQRICIPSSNDGPEIEPASKPKNVVPTVSTKKKNTYNLALLLPFATYEMNADSLSERSSKLRGVAINLYRGAQMAKEQLEKRGVTANVYVFDVGDSKESIIQVCKRMEELNIDVVIGPLFKDPLIEVGKWADKRDVHVVVPVKMNNKILLTTHHMSKIYPSTASQWDYLARYAAIKYPEKKVILAYNGSKEDGVAAAARRGFREIKTQQYKGDSLQCFDVSKGYTAFTAALTAAKGQVIVLNACTDSKTFGGVFSALSGQGNAIVLGGEECDDYDYLSRDTRERYQVAYPKPVFLNYFDENDLEWITEFRREFKSEPSEFAAIGHDVVLYYATALYQFGTEFPEHMNEVDVNGLVGMGFDFFNTGQKSGFENTFVNVVEMKDFKWIQLNSSDSN